MTIDDKTLARVRALLAKAESTDFEEEAAAFTAKAQELMARYAIDQALLDRADPGRSAVTSRPVEVPSPYAGAKGTILAAVARANGCQVIRHRSRAGTTYTAFGFPSDLDATEVMFTSLLLQATRTMLADERSTVDGRGASGGARSFRHAYLVGFGARIGQRLAEATDQVRSQAGGAALVPVLADRDRRVRAEVARAYPRVRTTRPSLSNGAGLRSGMRAAERADLGNGRLGTG